MPRQRFRPCSSPGCAVLVVSGRCAGCEAAAEAARGSAAARGYGSKHRRLFRQRVLARANYLCVLRLPGCSDVASVADHWPLGRDELVLKGLNPNDPQYGRALCASCHGRVTAVAQPGGWNLR